MKNLPQRKQIRLKGYDYSENGYYFVTICTQDRVCMFGNINNVGVWRDKPFLGRDKPTMALNNCGEIVNNIWYSLPDHHPVQLDIFQIMPNHVHFILQIISGASSTIDSGALPEGSGASRRAPTKYKPTLGFIVGIFKTETTKQINKLNNTPGSTIWQRNYYEHIIRNEHELNKIREYIKSNPQMWERDRNNPEGILALCACSEWSRTEIEG